MNNFEGLTKEDFFNINPRISRGHRFKLSKNRPHFDIRKFNFSHRVVKHWKTCRSKKQKQDVEAKSINAFKKAGQSLLR